MRVKFSPTAEVKSLPDSYSEKIARMSHVKSRRARQTNKIIKSTRKMTFIAKVKTQFLKIIFDRKFSVRIFIRSSAVYGGIQSPFSEDENVEASWRHFAKHSRNVHAHSRRHFSGENDRQVQRSQVHFRNYDDGRNCAHFGRRE